jgi:hypothetical protein
LLAAGVASLAVVILAAAGLYLRAGPALPEPAPMPPAVPQPIEPAPEQSWKVLGAMSAHRALVMEVETARPEEAADIAAEIVEPVLDREYEEILIYIHREGSTTGLAARRVQWTPGGGYVETLYEDAR